MKNIALLKSLLIILALLLSINTASAAESVLSNNFTVTWYDCNYDLTQSSCKVDIQNLVATTNRDFNLSVLINSTNYNLNTYTTISTMKEWKTLPTDVPVYAVSLEINGGSQTLDGTYNYDYLNITYRGSGGGGGNANPGNEAYCDIGDIK